MLVESPSGFHALSLSPTVLAALHRARYFEPTPIQEAFVPEALKGRDVIGQAQTGTGKTAAFLLPFFNTWRDNPQPGPQALILAPTRELVVQVAEEANKLSPSRHCRAVPIYGGQRIRKQLLELKRGAAIVVGTPGRILDHLARGTLTFHNARYVVLDEADRMLDIGFRPDIEKILRRCPRERQTLLLSATVPPPVERLARTYMRDPEIMDFSPKTKAVDTIEQFYFTVDQEQKYELLVRLLKREKPEQAIVFCRTKRGTEKILRRLSKHFPEADMMHGDMVQGARDRVMKKFRAKEVQILVATDVVGRGIDVSS